MGERIKRITGSLYWRQFMLTAGMVVLTMALLGVSFYALSYNYTVSEKRQEMQDRAVLVAQLSVDYFTAGDDAERDQGDALRSLAGVASRMTDVDFLRHHRQRPADDGCRFGRKDRRCPRGHYPNGAGQRETVRGPQHRGRI